MTTRRPARRQFHGPAAGSTGGPALAFATALGLLLAAGPSPILANPDAAGVSEGVTSRPAASQAAAMDDLDDDPEGVTRQRQHEQYRRLAGPLLLVTAAALAVVTVALVIWILHWGRRLRGAPIGRSARVPGPDPWAVAGERFADPPLAGPNVDPPPEESP